MKMLVKAKSKYIRVSPYKLRPFVNVIRGYSVEHALAWLRTCSVKRVRPLMKVLYSAYANARNLNANLSTGVKIKEIKVDQGPIIKYFKPGAMGRANLQRKRLSHIEVTLDVE